MKNETKSIINRRRRFLKIFAPIALIVIMGVNCFASPTQNPSTNSRPLNYIGDSGQFYATFSSYMGYNATSFAVGITGKGTSLNFGSITAESVDLNAGYPSSDVVWKSTYTSSDVNNYVYLYAPIVQYGSTITNFSFNVGGTVSISYQYPNIGTNGEADGTFTTYSYTEYLTADTKVYMYNNRYDAPPVVDGAYVYFYTVTFQPTNPSQVSMSFTDSYNATFISNIISQTSNQGYLDGYTNGKNFGWETGYDQGYIDGETDGISEGRDLGYEQGIKDANFDFNGIGGFIDIMLRGQRYYVLNNDGTLKLDSDGDPIVEYDGGVMSTPLFGESFPWITIGNVLGSFVAISLATFIMKLFLGG